MHSSETAEIQQCKQIYYFPHINYELHVPGTLFYRDYKYDSIFFVKKTDAIVLNTTFCNMQPYFCCFHNTQNTRSIRKYNITILDYYTLNIEILYRCVFSGKLCIFSTKILIYE